jgi:aspartate/methionine/tyrosine aminotransferase
MQTSIFSAAERTRQLTSFLVMDVLEKANAMEREGIDIIHLEVGEPDFDTPQVVVEAAEKALADGKTHYTHSMGIIELREALCEHYLETYGVTVHPEQVIISSGTSPALLLACCALINPGDSAVLPDPYYACYPNFVRFAGGIPAFVPTDPGDGFQYKQRRVAEHVGARTKAIFLNSPSNPAGTHTSEGRIKALTELHPYIISDEIYHGLTYTGKDRCILEFTPHAFVLNGLSKLYAMTGWRLGWLIAPQEFIRPMQVMCQNFFISANAVSQWAAITALKETADETERMRKIYNERREFMLQRLRSMGFTIAHEPTGAFYILADARFLSSDSLSLAFDILEKAHVGVTPGIDFGAGAEGMLRFSYANSLENIAVAMDRLETYIERSLNT